MFVLTADVLSEDVILNWFKKDHSTKERAYSGTDEEVCRMAPKC